MIKRSTRAAGIDTGKYRLDIALYPSGECLTVENCEAGHHQLLAWLKERRIKRIGIEASGGYEADVVRRLRAGGLKVAVLQPRLVRGYAVFKGKRAKNDRIDAALIAECTAHLGKIGDAPDARLAPFAKHLLFIEQMESDIACLRNRLEHCDLKRVLRIIQGDIDRLDKRLTSELALLRGLVCKHADLAHRLDLIESVDGIGPRTALALVILLPELGTLDRERIVSLVGVAPFDDKSGERDGQKHIAGGRDRVRRALYNAALPAAYRWNKELILIYQRLTARQKPHKVALIACVRKLVIFINAVVERGTPWVKSPPSKLIPT